MHQVGFNVTALEYEVQFQKLYPGEFLGISAMFDIQNRQQQNRSERWGK